MSAARQPLSSTVRQVIVVDSVTVALTLAAAYVGARLGLRIPGVTTAIPTSVAPAPARTTGLRSKAQLGGL